MPEWYNRRHEPRAKWTCDACGSLMLAWTSTATLIDVRDINIEFQVEPGIGPTLKNVVSVCTLR